MILRGPQGPWALLALTTFLITLLQAKEAKHNSVRLESPLAPASSWNPFGIWKKSNVSSSDGTRGQIPMTPRHKRQEGWDDWEDDFDDDIFGPSEPESDGAHVTTSTLRSTTLDPPTTVDLPTSLGAEEHLRTVRETDDEDLIGSGEEGSGEHPEPHPDGPSTARPEVQGDPHKRFYRVTLTINKPWSPALTSNTSPAFKVYEDELSDAITRSSAYDIASVKVNQFTDIQDPAYVQVTFDVGIEDVPIEEIEAEFNSFLDVGAVGNIRLKRDNFSIRDVGSPLDPGCFDNELKCRNGRCLSITMRCNGADECGDGTDEENCPVMTTTTTTTTEMPPSPTPFSEMEDCRADDQVRCFDGRAIICADQVCDGHINCPGGEDEDARMNCSMSDRDCERGHFNCDLDKCLPDSAKCNGIQECNDGFDENVNDCPPKRCTSLEFTCHSDGACVPISAKCNQRNDCQDGSDEANCVTPSCRSNEYRCEQGGQCLSINRRCDRIDDCPGGDDERGCGFPAPEPAQCTSSQFRCRDGTCIGSSLKCDGFSDCPDNTDEDATTCPARPTPPPVQCSFGQFRCRDGTCISALERCQGKVDCPDSSDEEGCSACLDSFRCSSGQCIDNRYKCDGTPQCPGADDEQNCGSTCSRDQFPCANGQCIPLLYKCDSVPDCADNSDETPETCPDVMTCAADEFKCIAGGCIPREKLCDRRFDCADGSDEVSASCPPACREDEFRCVKDGSCVPLSAKCNRRSDCSDDSDEQNCPPQPTRCGFGEFTCRSGNQCVPASAVCNSIYDCNDYSDEGNCGSPPEGLHLKTYPSDQSIKQGNEVVFQCRDEGQLRASVRWVRGNGMPLPVGSRDYNGRLEMPNILVEHSGTYICEAVGYPESTPGAKVAVYLRVDPYEAPPTRPPTACALHEATCSNGDCIAKNMICDGDQDCADGSDEMRCRLDGCEPNEFQCYNKKCVLKTWRCDGDDDCGDSSDEQNCEPPPPGSPCRYNEFQCANGQNCIMKSFQCDKEFDCPDRSDEIGCSAPSIITPPPSLVTLDVGDVFNISCRVHGIPTPEVVWRLNWGHIPDKCTTMCENGVGVLTCMDIQHSEQGAYSCEAINSLGSTFAIPDCMLVVRDQISECGPGKFNELARTDDECLPCFCFGQTTKCSSAKLYVAELPPPEANYHLLGVSQDLLNGSVQIEARRAGASPSLRPGSTGGVQATNIRTDFLAKDVIPFFALPEPYVGNHLKSYGGNLRYRLKYRGSSSVISGPDVVISGNGITLLHVGGQSWTTGREHEVTVRFWTEEWFKGVYGRPGGPVQGVQPATREELMMVLAKMDNLLIRAQYDQGSVLDVTVSHIRMTSASTANTGLGQAVSVEQCQCPPGYMGLSCEECVVGYERVEQGPWLGRCMPVRERCPEGSYDDVGQCRPCPCPGAGRRFGKSCYRDTDGEVTCACNEGHTGRNCANCASGYAPNPNYPYDCRPIGVRCDVDGSLSPTPDPFTQRCNCKENAVGPLCNQCKAGTFHLSSDNQFGCINCFCMGIVTQCASSSWYRIQERSSFFQSPQGFALVDAGQQHTPLRNLTVESSGRELAYRGFTGGSGLIYYWQLPEQYLGDKVTSYGGYLNYTVRYVPPPGGQTSPNTGADVEINGNDIRLLYFRRGGTLAPNRPETVSVPLLEQYWQRADGRVTNREHLLMALANLDALLIKATYTTYSRETYLSEVSFDYAIPRNTGQDRAWPVEECQCPEGYLGLSCQECSSGFTRSLKGLYLGLCERCSCNGHSDECDPKTGICKNCRGFTTGEFCDECEEGYTGNPKFGECRPSFPSSCRCDPRGSVRADCPDGRNCLCKGNVEGPTCASCRRGTFSLQESNPQGCLQCFCSGVSSDCSSAHLYRLPIRMEIQTEPHGFTLTDSYRTSTIREITVDPRAGELVYSFLANSPRRERLFWSLPPKFTGDRVASYGGKLRAIRRYYVRPGTVANPTEDIDVILIGKNGVSLFYAGSRPAVQTVELDVTLAESAGWRHSDGTAKPANRDDLLGVLADVEAILVRATFTEDMESTHLKDVSLDDAVRQFTQYGVVSDIEECRCPFGYTGLSCESCSAMFYRDPNDRSRNPSGSCRKCPCGENAEGCSYDSGRPVCTCRPGFSGVDCATRGGPEVPPQPPSPNPDESESETAPGGSTPEIEVRIQEPTYKTADTGSSALFRCSARSQSGSQLRVTWVKEVGSIPVGRARDDGQGLLVISDIRPEDDGTYVCQATDGYSTASERATLAVGGRGTPQPPPESKPEVTITPRYLTLSAGSPAEFRCTATGYPPATITWSGGRTGQLPPHARTQGGVLSFSAVRKSDEAEYHCRAENSQGVSSLRTILYVQGEDESPQPEPEKPPLTVAVLPAEADARPGETVRLRCEPSDRSARVQWNKVGQSLPQSSTQSPDGQLTIYSVSEDDSGVYSCVATAEDGESAQGQSRLQVSYAGAPPAARIEPERQTVSQGSEIEVRCIATGSPQPTIQWSRVGAPLAPGVDTNSEVLRIPNAQITDRGVYVCNVENSAGKSLASGIVEVERREPPQVEIYPSSRQVALKDSSVLFQCRLSAGIPTPRVTWARADGLPMPRNIEEIQGGVLRFNRVSGDEKGSYICTAENVAGTTTATAFLEIQVPPTVTVTPSSPHRVNSGDRVRLECRGEGDPLPTVSWSRLRHGQLEGVSLPLSSDVFRTPQNAVYEISRVTKADEGSYSCTARNDAGSEEGRLQLLVEDGPGDGGSGGPAHPTSGHVPPTRPEPEPASESAEVYYFPVGSRAELRCSQDIRGGGFEQLYLDWERADGGLMPSNYEAKDGSLIIDSVRPEDAGRYSCVGTNRQGQTVFSSDAILEVSGSSPPQIELRPARQVVRRGDTVFIHCAATGQEPITINWSRVDRTPFYKTVTVNGPDLMFRPIEVVDAGRYACTASNSGGTTEAVAEVIVNSGQQGSNVLSRTPRPARTRTQTGTAGQPIELLCRLDGPGIIWSKDNGPVPRTAIPLGPSLTLMSLSPNDAGRYSCESDQGYDEIELSVQALEPVTVRVTANKDLVSAGEDVEVRCDVAGDANPYIRWHKVGGAMGNNVKIRENILVVASAMPDNMGIYRCVATTKTGIYEDDYALTMQANPANMQRPETQKVPFGSIVTMNCTTDLHDPQSYTWTKKGGLIPDRSTMEGITLTIPDVIDEDSGIYVCTASNPTDTEDIPKILTVTGVVPYFTQAPTSFMTLPTLSSYHDMDITISFKPEDKNGLILYNGQRKDGTGDFFSFGLTSGVPQFKLDLGSGLVTIKGDRPLEMGKWSTVTLTRDKVVGSMMVNGMGPFMGQLRGNFEGLDLIEPLYVGGVQNFRQINRMAEYTKGFLGCISELIISGKKQPLRDFQTSRGISSCDTCAGISCLNGGICQEGLTSRGYKCICNPGFSGLECQIPVEACRPGSCGPGKCLDGPSGYECQCPFGKAGERCNEDIEITEASFNGNSYLSYPTPKALKRLKMSVRVKPESNEDGLLIYSSQSNNGDGDYASLSLKDSHLEFQYDTGSGPAVIRSRRSVTVGEWTEVTMERDGQDGSLTLEGDETIKGRSKGTTRGLNLNTPLYLGGFDRSRIQVNSNVKVNHGFKGCVSKLDVEGTNLDLIQSKLDGANVEQCGSRDNIPRCASNPCQNRGFCTGNTTTYACSCPPEFTGRNCEIEKIDRCSSQPCINGGSCHNLGDSFKCSCPKGFHGRTCQTSLSFEESLAFRGEGYLELRGDLFPHHDPEAEEFIQLEISTTSKHGLLFWQGQRPHEDGMVDDFVSVGLLDGRVEFAWNLGSGEGSAISEKVVDDGERHTIILRRTGVEGSIEVDGGELDAATCPGMTQMLNTPGNIFVGGAPNVRGMTHGRFSDGFIGCVHSVRIKGPNPLNLNNEAISAINTGPCEKSSDGHDRIVSQKREEKIEREGNKTIKTTKVITNVTEYYYSSEEDGYPDDTDFHMEGRHN